MLSVKVRVRLQEQEQAEQRAAFRSALESALKWAAPRPPPGAVRASWADGPFAEAVAHLETFAKGKSDAPHGHAMYALLDTGSQVTPDGAAQLLKRLGIWPKHVPTPVVRSAAAAAAAAAQHTAAVALPWLCTSRASDA